MDQNRTSKILIIAGMTLTLIGLFAGIYLVQYRQTVKSKASEPQLNIELISPNAGARVLGTTNIRANAKTLEDIKSLQAILKINGHGQETLKVERLSDDIILSGKWDSSSLNPGDYTLEILLYKKIASELILLGSGSISVTVVTP